MLNYSIGNAFLNAMFARGEVMIGNALSEACYIGASTTVPVQDPLTGKISNFTEPDPSTGYSRMRLGIQGEAVTHVMDAASANEIKNGENFIYLGEALEGSGGFGTVVWFGLFPVEAVNSGSPLVAGELTEPVTVEEKHVLLFRPGDLKVTMS